MTKALPTIRSPHWTCGDFLTSVHEAFKTHAQCFKVRMYFYGATKSGWDAIRIYAKQWLGEGEGRTIDAYIGTDHALTEPQALTAMEADGVTVHLLTCYSGIFHPKLIVFAGDIDHLLLSGSNNLTRSGLSSNIEFATAIRIPASSAQFANWESAVQKSSDVLTDALRKNYERERNRRLRKLQGLKVPWQFTWRKRRGSSIRTGAAIRMKLPIPIEKGTLLYEVMPKETGPMGQQIQILKKVAIGYFGLPNKVGASLVIELKNISTGASRQLTMTYNRNTTMRLSIHEASFTERPCFLIFRKDAGNAFSFIVISEALDPAQFQALDKKLGAKLAGRRRWMAF